MAQVRAVGAAEAGLDHACAPEQEADGAYEVDDDGRNDSEHSRDRLRTARTLFISKIGAKFLTKGKFLFWHVFLTKKSTRSIIS